MPSPSAGLVPLPLDDDQSSRLGVALEGLTPEQLQWVSGYVAGLAAANGQAVAPPAAEADGGPTLTILYGSQTGNGEGVARALEAEASAQGFAVSLASLAEYKPSQLKREALVTFVVSTHGEGDPPDDAELFREFLLSAKAPKLPELKYAVLALGDSSYINFCQTGREFDERLAALGAERLLPIAECDVDYEDAANAWRQSVVGALPTVLQAKKAVPRLRAVAPPAKYDKSNPFPAEILVNQKITGRGSSKDVRHIELSLEGSGLHYEPGDSLAVVADNPPALIEQLAETLDLDLRVEVDVRDERVHLGDALRDRLEITAANVGFLKTWAALARDPELDATLEDKTRLAALIDTHQIIDVVRRFPARFDDEESRVDEQQFADSLRRLSPRSYSIASSESANPDEVHLTVAAVRYQAFGSEHWGAASTQLAHRLEEGRQVRVFVEPNSRFRLPPDDSTDIIMIGPGTGVAPFRAFVEERAERGARGRNWLFFGDRRFSSDFLYQLEWQRHLKRGNLARLDLAFSRDQQDKIYVQHRLREHGAAVNEWLAGGAHLYVCGDAKHMAGDVDDALIGILAEHRGLSAEAAEDELKALRRSGRYQRDVY